jgi:hypothetical protein
VPTRTNSRDDHKPSRTNEGHDVAGQSRDIMADVERASNRTSTNLASRQSGKSGKKC